MLRFRLEVVFATLVCFCVLRSAPAQAPDDAPLSPEHQRLIGVWMIDFKAMESEPLGVEFLNSAIGGMTRVMAFHRATVFTPDGLCEFYADSDPVPCTVITTPDGDLRVSLRPDPNSGEEPRVFDASITEGDRLLLKSSEVRGIVLRRVSDLQVPGDDPTLAARWAALSGDWRLDLELYYQTDWYRALPPQTQPVFRRGVSGAGRIVMGDDELRFEDLIWDEKPVRALTKVLGIANDGGLVVRFTIPDEEGPARQTTIVIREDGPDLIWLHAGLEAKSPFRRSD